jgi:sugar phosphate isomerase/epimerase
MPNEPEERPNCPTHAPSPCDESRRRWLAAAAGGLAALSTAAPAGAAPREEVEPARDAAPLKVRYCLNTSTIRGQNVGIVRECEIAAAAGYDAVEPWMNTLDDYVKNGGSLRDLGKRIRDLGLTVESAIGFAQWIVDDEQARRSGLEQARRDMDALRQIGGTRIAAPPVGAHDKPGPPLLVCAERYRALLEIGNPIGVVPQMEVWGFSQTLSRLGESVCVMLEAQHPQACLLPDVYHLRRGGSDLRGMRLLSAAAVHCFHFNDYPAVDDRTKLTDADRVYPGDGAAPWKEIIGDLRSIGFHGVVSLELFNRDYWKQDPLEVARTGLEKMRAVVACG